MGEPPIAQQARAATGPQPALPGAAPTGARPPLVERVAALEKTLAEMRAYLDALSARTGRELGF